MTFLTLDYMFGFNKPTVSMPYFTYNRVNLYLDLPSVIEFNIIHPFSGIILQNVHCTPLYTGLPTKDETVKN